MLRMMNFLENVFDSLHIYTKFQSKISTQNVHLGVCYVEGANVRVQTIYDKPMCLFCS
jgi:hypothetical protein